MSLSIQAAQVRRGRPPMAARRMGDPGFFGNLLKGVVGGVTGLVTGGPGGAISGAIQGFRGPQRQPTRQIPERVLAGPGGQRAVPAPGLRAAGQRAIRGGASGFVAENGTKLACPSGFHPNKTAYFLRDGTFVEEGSRCVKNRRRNPLNPRALKRAVSRIDAGKRWQAELRDIETGKHTKAGFRKDSC